MRTLLLISAQLLFQPNWQACFLLVCGLVLHRWVGEGWQGNNRVSESNESLVSSPNFPASLLMPQGLQGLELQLSVNTLKDILGVKQPLVLHGTL